jgi:pyruvate formate lyase activating enzyme
MAEALIQKIIDSSVVDGPGNRTAIFFQGCNFNCTYCHNPETISLTSETAILMTLQEVLERIKGNLPFIQGITVSGGECTLQRDFLLPLFKETKELGLSNFIDSNGGISFEGMAELLAYTDGVMLDIKAVDPVAHLSLTGHPPDVVLDNALGLAAGGKLYEIRTVVIRDVLDNPGIVEAVSRMLKPYLKDHEIRYKLIRVRSHGVRPAYQNLLPPREKEMEKLKAIAVKAGFFEVTII